MRQTTNIQEFWQNREAYRNLPTEQLIDIVTSIYTEDFINNYSIWIKNLKDLNQISFNNIAESFSDTHWWVDMTFDYFCKHILENIKNQILETNTIESSDILNIVQKLINDYIYNLIGEYNNKIKNTKENFDLYKSINKVKFIYE